MSRFSISYRSFCLTVPKKFVGEPFCAVFHQKFLDKKGGVSGFSVEKFSSHGAKNFGRGEGESYSVSIFSGIEKFHVAEDYVTIFDFLSEFFCLTVAKQFVGEPFCAVFQQKFMDKKGGEYQDFPSKNFRLTVPKFR